MLIKPWSTRTLTAPRRIITVFIYDCNNLDIPPQWDKLGSLNYDMVKLRQNVYHDEIGQNFLIENFKQLDEDSVQHK